MNQIPPKQICKEFSFNEVQYYNPNCFPRKSRNNTRAIFLNIKVEIHLRWEYLLTYQSDVT